MRIGSIVFGSSLKPMERAFLDKTDEVARLIMEIARLRSALAAAEARATEAEARLGREAAS